MRHTILPIMISFLVAGFAFTQSRYDLNEPVAKESFRLAVQAYHQAKYAEALALFEKTFAIQSDSSLVAYWLGKTYLKNGYESIALERFITSISLNNPSVLIENKIAKIKAERFSEKFDDNEKYTCIASLESNKGSSPLFKYPVSVFAEKDNSILVPSFASNEVLRLDTNGQIKARFNGGALGFEGPYSIVSTRDGYWLSEFRGNRITKLDLSGNIVKRIESKSRQDQLIGPQHIALDEYGYLFVVDFGNSRIVRLDLEGNVVQQFGKSGYNFNGLKMPTGIAVKNNRVYVSDRVLKSIFVFDYAGNYLETLCSEQLSAPEGLYIDNTNKLFIADTTRVLALSLDSLALNEIFRPERKKTRITGVTQNMVGDVIFVDVDSNAVEYLSKLSSIYSGLSVDIERIDASKFPGIEMDVSVKDNYGNPVIGLDIRNFFTTERIQNEEILEEDGTPLKRIIEKMIPAVSMEVFPDIKRFDKTSVSIILECSPEMNILKKDLSRSLELLIKSAANYGSYSFIAASATAYPVTSENRSISSITNLPVSTNWRLDQALRLAVNGLVRERKNRAIFYMTTGSINENTLTQSSLADLASFCRNNDVTFNAVHIGNRKIEDSLIYLVNSTNGKIWDSNLPEGFQAIIKDIADSNNGKYKIRFRSSANSGRGTLYQDITVEAYLFKKSGKDEIGYFAPFQ